MVQGFKNAPFIFQQIMETLFHDMFGSKLEIYFDDILIKAKTIEEHNKLLTKYVEDYPMKD